MNLSDTYLQEFTSTNTETGEVKPFLQVMSHPCGKTARLLNKKRAGSDERMDYTEMCEWLGQPEQSDWKDRLGYAEHPEYGGYFYVSGAKAGKVMFK